MARIGLEVPVATVDEARLAVAAGADRLELCADLDAGGVSADHATIHAVIEASPVPVAVMARPRDGDFVYGRFEIDEMLRVIRVARLAGAAAVVFGVLTRDGAIDAGVCRRAIEASESVPCVFHRAFDDIRQADGASVPPTHGAADYRYGFNANLESLIALGFARVLTGGGDGSGSPASGSRIARLLRQAAGRIEILPGGGIRAKSVADLLRAAPATFVHSGCRTKNADGRYGPLDEQAVRGLRAALDRLS